MVNESNSVEFSESHCKSSTDWTDSTCNNVISPDTLAGCSINYCKKFKTILKEKGLRFPIASPPTPQLPFSHIPPFKYSTCEKQTERSQQRKHKKNEKGDEDRILSDRHQILELYKKECILEEERQGEM